MRYLVVTGVNSAMGGSVFPYGTLAVNALGCFLIGLIVGFADARQPLSTEAQAFLIVGVLGGIYDFFGVRDRDRQAAQGRLLLGWFGLRAPTDCNWPVRSGGGTSTWADVQGWMITLERCGN